MAEHTVIMENTLRKLLAEKKLNSVRDVLVTMNPADVAWVLDKVHFLDRIRFISLGNLCLGREAFRELLQWFFTPESASEEVRRLVEDAPYRERMLADYAEIRQCLGGSGASRRVARAMIEELSSFF